MGEGEEEEEEREEAAAVSDATTICGEELVKVSVEEDEVGMGAG